MTNIIRRRNGTFTIVGNAAINDDRLSFEALGLLAYLLSKPDNWKVMVNQLSGRGGCGRDRTRRILNELIEAGYILRHQPRASDGGVFGEVSYIVFDEPGAPLTENPAPENPAPENPPLVNTERTTKTEKAVKTDPDERPAGLFETEDQPTPPDPAEAAVAAWNTFAADVGLAKVQKLTTTRRNHLRQRLSDCGGLVGWTSCLEIIRGSPHLLGATAPRDGGQPWRATFDWLTESPTNFAKVMEGQYLRRRGRDERRNATRAERVDAAVQSVHRKLAEAGQSSEHGQPAQSEDDFPW